MFGEKKYLKWGRGCLGLMAVAAVALTAGVTSVKAESAAKFYRGKNVRLLIGYGAGGSYDSYARLVARHLGGFIPGKPTMVPQNKPGSGSLVATNYLYNVAPKDGSMIAAVGQAVYFMQLLERPKIKFDARKFNWIGRMTDVTSLVVAWHKSKAKTIADLQKVKVPIAVGGTLSGSTLTISFLNKLTNTKFQPIKGYRSAGALLAMERGEVDGTASVTWLALKAKYGKWVKEKKVNVLVQVGLNRAPGLENVPLLSDLGKSESDRTMLRVLSSTNAIGRAISAPPGVPADRVKALRGAFDAMVKSKKFLAEAKRIRHPINPMSGDALRKVVLQAGDLTPEMIKKIQSIVAIKYRSIKKKKKKKKKKKNM
jgi:tripartite-type tricarboxylate transporter receptor subunit TctC